MNGLAERFRRAVAAYPANTAVYSNLAEYSYADVAGYANRIAVVVSAYQGKKGIVAIWLPKGVDYIAAVLATLQCGHVFLPLERSWPGERLKSVLLQAEPFLIITDSESRFRKAVDWDAALNKTPLLVLHGPQSEVHLVGQVHGKDREAGSLPETAGYVMYTSGSTGKPKGILGREDSLLHFIDWETQRYSIDTEVRIPQLAPVSFDVSLRDIFVPLLSGGSAWVPPPHVMENPVTLAGWFGETGMSVVHIVPSLVRLLIREAPEALRHGGAADSIQRFLLAGEPLYNSDVLGLRSVFGEEVGITNLYGPSETTLAKCFFDVPQDGWKGEIVPLGHPLPDTEIRIWQGADGADPQTGGEIVITTPFASYGYLDQAALTAERFDDLEKVRSCQRVSFRSGDHGFIDGDGLLHYQGRTDHMIKVRGNRVELLEVEATMRRAVATEVAAAVERLSDGDCGIHCFYVSPARDEELERGLWSFAENHLPSYMRPSTYNAVQSLPVTTNGKLDRAFLIERRANNLVSGGELPENDDLARKIASYWGEALSIAVVPFDVPFRALGGSSLKAMQVIGRIYKNHRVSICVADFASNETVQALTAFVRSREKPTKRAPRARNRSDAPPRYPLSPYEELMWEIAQYPAAAAAYNEYVAVEFAGDLSVEVCQRIPRILVERHEILRCAYIEVAGRPIHELRPIEDGELAGTYVDLRTETNPDAAWREHLLSEADRPFDLGKPPLFRWYIYRTCAQRYVLGSIAYHIIADLASVDILMGEAIALYLELTNQRGFEAPALRPLSRQYRDFVSETADLMRTDPEQRAFWAGELPRPLPELTLSDGQRPFLRTFDGASVDLAVGPATCTALTDLAVRQGISKYVVLLSAYALLLARAGKSDDVVIGCAVSLRDKPDLESQVGHYLNTIPLYLEPASEETVDGLLASVNRAVGRAMRHKEYPVQEIADAFDLPMRVSRAAIYDTVFTITERDSALPPLVNLPRRRAKFDLMANLTVSANAIHGYLEYNTNILSESAARSLADDYLDILAAMARGILCVKDVEATHGS